MRGKHTNRVSEFIRDICGRARPLPESTGMTNRVCRSRTDQVGPLRAVLAANVTVGLGYLAAASDIWSANALSHYLLVRVPGVRHTNGPGATLTLQAARTPSKADFVPSVR